MNDTVQTILDRLTQVTADLYACFDRQARLVHETEMLRQQLALLATPWPRQVVLAVYPKDDALWTAGQHLGLTGDALRCFERSDEYTVTLAVTQDGHSHVVACNDRPLVRDDQPPQTQGASYG